MRRGQPFLQVDGLLVLLHGALRVAAEQVHVSEVVPDDCYRARRGVFADRLQCLAVELLRLAEVAFALRLVRYGECRRGFGLLGPQPILQPAQLGQCPFAVLQHPDVRGRTAERGHASDAFRRERQRRGQHQHHATQRHFRGRGVQRDGEKQSEEQRHEARL